jgi:hypothetical protein
MIQNFKVYFQFSFAGNATTTADQPIDFGMESDRAGFDVLGNVQLEWKKNFVFVAIIHQRAERQPLGRWELHRSGCDPGRQRPLNMRRFACIARIHPVNMPARFELEVEASIIPIAIVELASGNEQFHSNVVRLIETRPRPRGQAGGKQQ